MITVINLEDKYVCEMMIHKLIVKAFPTKKKKNLNYCILKEKDSKHDFVTKLLSNLNS